MAMTMLYAVEQALVKLYASSSMSASVRVYGGVDDETKVAPCIICDAMQAREDFQDGGVWHVATDIKLRAMAGDSTPIAFDALADNMYSLVLSDTLDLGSGSADLSVYDIVVVNSQQQKSGDAWEALLQLDIVGVNNG